MLYLNFKNYTAFLGHLVHCETLRRQEIVLFRNVAKNSMCRVITVSHWVAAKKHKPLKVPYFSENCHYSLKKEVRPHNLSKLSKKYGDSKESSTFNEEFVYGDCLVI